MASVFDLHVHTNLGSPDSSLAPEELSAEANRLGLTGVMVTERLGWPIDNGRGWRHNPS